MNNNKKQKSLQNINSVTADLKGWRRIWYGPTRIPCAHCFTPRSSNRTLGRNFFLIACIGIVIEILFFSFPSFNFILIFWWWYYTWIEENKYYPCPLCKYEK